MNEFFLKISIFPPNATTKQHPLIQHPEIIFDCSNISPRDAIDTIFKNYVYQNYYKNHNGQTEYLYITDKYGMWHYYDDVINI